MWNIKKLAILLILLAGIVACQPQAEEALPTLAGLPTELPSNTPTDTPTFTVTPSPTTTLTPTITRTPTSTWTAIPSATSTFTLTPTPSVTATFTLTFTPSASPTFTLTPTSVLPIINNFSANVTTAQAGSQINLRWDAVGDSFRIERLDSQGGVQETFGGLTATGTLSVTLPTTGTSAIYRLTAERGGLSDSFSVPITLSCITPWFYGDTFAPSGIGCPAGPAQTLTGAFQPFQTGVMIHYTDGVQNRVCGLQVENMAYLCYQNGWDGSTITPDSPPAGFFSPKQMFNWAYYNTNASGGLWNTKIGWGTTDIDGNPITLQMDSQNRLFLGTPQGVYYLNGNVNSGVWTKIK